MSRHVARKARSRNPWNGLVNLSKGRTQEMLVPHIARERDGGVEIETRQGDVLRIADRRDSRRLGARGFEDDARRFEITREAIVRFPKQPGDDGPKAALTMTRRLFDEGHMSHGARVVRQRTM